MLKQELLDILVCPKCKGDLEYQTDSANSSQGKLLCYECKLVFKVEDDIPVMLLDEAQNLEVED